MTSQVELGWRRFNFFDRQLVKDAGNPLEPFLALQELDAVGVCVAQNCVFIGESSGGVCQMSDAYVIDRWWRAHEHHMIGTFAEHRAPLTHLCSDLCHVPTGNLLVTIGRDSATTPCQLKVWHLGRATADAAPFCSRITTLRASKTSTADASSVACDASGTLLAVGYRDSTLQLFVGDVVKERTSKLNTTLAPLSGVDAQQDKLSNDGVDGAVHTLRFGSMADKACTVLFAAADKAVVSLVITDGAVVKKTVHTVRSSARHCCALNDDRQFIVANRDLVHQFSVAALEEDCADGRCNAFDADKTKQMCAAFGAYVVLVTEQNTMAAADSAMHMVGVYDLTGRYIAYCAPLSAVTHAWFANNALHLLCKNGRLYTLHEQSLNQKLQVLFRKNLYDVAIGLARRHRCAPSQLSDIYQQHADYLYEKGDYDNAIQQYIHTIGHLQPSYVIRKFADTTRIVQLSHYIEALHGRQMARAEHTTILLNCYTQLNDAGNIDRFIDTIIAAQNVDEQSEDVSTAVHVLLTSGFADAALRLAKSRAMHDACVRILVDNKHDYEGALKYLATLPADIQSRHLQTYGKTLVRHCPQATTQLVLDSSTAGGGADMVNVFVDNADALCTFLEHRVKVKADDGSDMRSYRDTLLELYLRQHATSPTPQRQRTLEYMKQYYCTDDHTAENTTQALLLCHTFDFAAGTLLLYAHGKRHMDILEHHVKQGDMAAALQCCRQFGASDAVMWCRLLEALADQPTAVDAALMTDVLTAIETGRILPPIQVLDVLSRSATVTLGDVKTYLLSGLRTQSDEVAANDKRIAALQTDIARTEGAIDELTNNAAIFQVSKCTACDGQLEVPTVHLLCKHAFHQLCYDGYADVSGHAATACPACARLAPHETQATVMSAHGTPMRLPTSAPLLYQHLRQHLRETDDCVHTLAEHVALGVFSMATSTTKRAPPAGNPFGDDDDNDVAEKQRSLNPFE